MMEIYGTIQFKLILPHFPGFQQEPLPEPVCSRSPECDGLGQLEKRERHYLAVAVDGGMRRLDAAEIYYLESEGHKVHFYTEKEDFVVPGTLKNYEEKLVGRAFARCNSGYLVNLAQVSGVQQDMVQVGPYALQISRPRRKAFMAELADYIGGAGQ